MPALGLCPSVAVMGGVNAALWEHEDGSVSKSQVRRNRKGEAAVRAEGLGVEHRGSVSTRPYCLTVCWTCSHRSPSVCPRIWPPSAIGVH